MGSERRRGEWGVREGVGSERRRGEWGVREGEGSKSRRGEGSERRRIYRYACTSINRVSRKQETYIELQLSVRT